MPLQRLRQLDRLLAGAAADLPERQPRKASTATSTGTGRSATRRRRSRTCRGQPACRAKAPATSAATTMSGSVVYSRGVFAALGRGAERAHQQRHRRQGRRELTLQIGGAYNFGRRSRCSASTRTSTTRAATARASRRRLGVSAPLGPGTVLAQIARSTSKGPAVDPQAHHHQPRLRLQLRRHRRFLRDRHGRPDQQPDPRPVLRRRGALPVLSARSPCYLAMREQHRVVDRVDRAVGADRGRRVRLADAAGRAGCAALAVLVARSQR